MAVTLSQISFNSENESEKSDSERPTTSKTCSVSARVIWKLQQTFPSVQAAQEFMKADWCIKFTNKRKFATSVMYYCKNHGQQCNAKSKLVYPETSLDVQYYVNEDFHHTGARKCGLLTEQKVAIIDMLKDGIQKPKQILKCLEDRSISVPLKSQLVGFLQRKRRAEGQTVISMGQLDNWCSLNHQVPELTDEPFVVSYDTFVDENDDDGSYLHLLVTTRRLLSFLPMTQVLHADSTYKLNYEGLPVSVFGVSDANRKFHPVAIALSTTEQVLTTRSSFKL